MKKPFKLFLIILIVFSTTFGMGCSDVHHEFNEDGTKGETSNEEEGLIVVGFSQLGAESDWRTANTQSVKKTLTVENGFKLIFEDAQQKQTNQITAIRSFIQQEVDYIVVAPVMETGWDTVLSEAKEAGIPVIIIDRMVDVSDTDLYEGWIGSDFELEGKKVCEWINTFTKKQGIDPKDVHIVDMQGTLGSTAQIGRTKGFDATAAKYGWDVIGHAEGDFTLTKGREAMVEILRTNSNVNVVYCENDNEALGVIEAVEANGRRVGNDIKHGEIMVVSFDGVNEDALLNLRSGKISCIGECNPNSGPKIRKYIEMLEKGEKGEKYDYLDERVFSSDQDITHVVVDNMEYNVTVIPSAKND